MRLLIIGQGLSCWVTLPGINEYVRRMARWNGPCSEEHIIIPQYVNATDENLAPELICALALNACVGSKDVKASLPVRG